MNNLLVLRKKHNKKAVDLAAELGVSRKHYYDLEKGNRRLNENHIKTFMRIYDCSADGILEHKYTKDDFKDNPEELDLEIEKIVRFLTLKPPYHLNPRFSGMVINLLDERFENIRRVHALDFKSTPSDIMQMVSEIDDFDFKLEILEILESVKSELLPYAAEGRENIFIKNAEIYKEYQKELEDQSGVLNERTAEHQSLYNLNSKEERDIAKDLEKMLSDLESDNAMAFNGEPMDDDDKAMLRISLENSMRLAKQMAKKKFNPNKNKK